MLQNLFTEILITSCIGAALAGVLALIRPITKKHFSSRWHYYMWLVVLLVMMCPIRLNLPEKQQQPVSEAAQISATQMATETIGEVNYTVSEPQTVTNKPVQSEAVYQEQQEITTESKVLVMLSIVMSSISILPILWIAVTALLFIFKLIGYGAFLLRMKRNSRIMECEEIKKYTRRKITVRTSDNISSPLMIGIIKPVLLLPDGELTDEQLDNILKHEMTHFKRHDILYKWFTALVKCVHWFNPAIYLISNQINIDCEISCDMAVTADMNSEEEISYIDTILALVSRANAKSVPLTTGMAGSKKILKKRFLTIRNRINTTNSSRIISRITAIVTAAVTLAASIAVLSGCDLPDNTGTANAAEPMNCLVAGTDEDGRIDTILLVSTDFKNATVISIPRDTKDIKEKYSLGLTGGNVKELKKTISNMLKIDIDKHVVIDLDTALKALGEIDGLELNIPDLYNDGIGMVYDDDYKDLHISLNPGEHALSAKEMLDYMRYVKRNPKYYLSGGDDSSDGGRLGRLYRQNDMLLSIMLQKQNIFDKTNLLHVAKSIPAYSKTNLSGEDMVNLYNLAKSIDAGNIYFDVLPGMYEDIDNIPYYVPDYNILESYISSHTYKPMNTDNVYQGNGFSIALPANAEITENGYKTGENLELLRAQILSVGSIVVQIEEKEYSSYDRDKILENYESWRNLDGERTIEDFHTITDESGREIGRSYALVINGEVMQYRSEYKYGNDTDESYALVTGDGETLEKRDKYNQRNSTLVVLAEPMTGEVFDSEANAALIKKYIDSFRLHDVSNLLEDTELTPLRISSMIFVNGDFTKEPIMQRDNKYSLEEYDIPQDIVLDSIFNRTNMGAAADEVDVIKTTDTALVMKKLQEHIDKQIDKFKSDTHEHEKLNDAVLVTYGDTVIFVVSENSEAVRQTIAGITTE